MKQFFVTAAACFVAFGLLVLSLVAVSYVPGWIDRSSGSGDEAKGRTDKPVGFQFLEHEHIVSPDKFTVRGVIQNTSKKTWNYPSIKIEIASNGRVINTCEGMAFGTFKPMSKRPFQIECEDIDNVPDQSTYRYKIFVDSASL
jgi:hypothetical protein